MNVRRKGGKGKSTPEHMWLCGNGKRVHVHAFMRGIHIVGIDN